MTALIDVSWNVRPNNNWNVENIDLHHVLQFSFGILRWYLNSLKQGRYTLWFHKIFKSCTQWSRQIKLFHSHIWWKFIKCSNVFLYLKWFLGGTQLKIFVPLEQKEAKILVPPGLKHKLKKRKTWKRRRVLTTLSRWKKLLDICDWNKHFCYRELNNDLLICCTFYLYYV
jgi:hypothetical protein